MLKQLSRLERTRNFIILGFALLMAVSLVIFYAPGRNSQYVEPAKNMQVVAKVNGDEITVADLAQLKGGYQQRLGGQMSLGNKLFLDALIRDRVVAQEAARLGLSCSNAELAERLTKQFSDPSSGKFLFTDASGNRDIQKYQDSIKAQYGDVERFERRVRDTIAQEKLRAFITASVVVSDDEVQADYKRKNTTFDLSYVIVSVDKLAEKLQPSDQDLRAYYDQHKNDYKISEPQKNIRYIYIEQEKVGEKLPISDKDLKDEYDKLDPKNKQAGVKVQQILLKVARPDFDSQQDQKGKDLLTKARGSDGRISEEKFAELAKGNSEDPATAKNGGFLPHPVKKNPNKVDALYDRAVDLDEGDVTDPIKYAGNWYILRRGAAVPKTFEEAKPELLVSLRNRRSFSVAAGIASRAKEEFKKSHDAQKVAQQFAAEANMNPADMVRETGYVKPGDDVKNIGSNQQFEQAISPLNNPNEVGEVTQIKGGFAIPMFIDKKDPRVPEFDEVKDQVAKTFKQQRAKEQLDQKARELAAAVNSAADLKAAADKAGLEATTDDGYKLGSALGKAGTSPALDEAIFALKDGAVTKTPIKVGDNLVIVGATKRQEADLAEFAKQRDQLKQSMLAQRQEQIFADYVSSATEQMRREGKIKIYKDVLDNIEDESEVAPQPRRPRFPIPTK